MEIPEATRPINKVKRLEDFIRLYSSKPKYYDYNEQIINIASKGGNSLIITYEDLLSFDMEIAEMLMEDPEVLMEDFIEAFKNVLSFHQIIVKDKLYFVQITSNSDKCPLTVPLRFLRAEHMEKLIISTGIVLRCSKIHPKMTRSTFECNICGSQFNILQFDTLRRPRFCIKKGCKAKSVTDFRLIKKKSVFINFQKIVIQELPETLPFGQIPRNFKAILMHDLVDSVRPGDRVKFTGIFTGRLASNKTTEMTTFIETNYIEADDRGDNVEITNEDIKKIEELSKDKDIQRKIANSIAPTIYGRDDLKMACGLSLFGGVRVKTIGGTYKRGDIHVLFVGDTGTGKSEIIKNVIHIAPRGMFSNGKGASGVGLTASVVKDDDGQYSLEAGVIVLANGGVTAIDEFDKMDGGDRSALHEAMEQQTISIAKAGIVATLNAQTSIMACANPRNGRYDCYKTPSQNINMPSSLLSRFDLIFVVKDIPDEKVDSEMADFVLDLYMQKPHETKLISRDLLKKYVQYAKKSCKPVLTEEVAKLIKEYYLTLRNQYSAEEAIVSMIIRNLDGLIRLCTAHAKMSLRNKVLKEDFYAVLELFKRYLNDVGFDEATGKIDVDRIFSGNSKKYLDKLEDFLSYLKEIYEDNNFKPLERDSIIQVIEVEKQFTKKYINHTLDELIKDRTLFELEDGKLMYSNKKK